MEPVWCWRALHLLSCLCVFTTRGIYHIPNTAAGKASSPVSKIHYTTAYLNVQVDHFGFGNQDKFALRYLVADQFWDRKHGPIFLYTGNEGDITWFCNNTGLMWDIAPEFNALLVFVEHRYYGLSLPYGQSTYKDLSHLGYLSSAQALADFADVVHHLQTTLPGAANLPVIAFGGSYGGMLAAWFRMKYPQSVHGALAASAPIWYFGNLTPCDSFYRITTEDFTRESPWCSDNIRKSWDVIDDLGKTTEGRDWLSRAFHLCEVLKSESGVGSMKGWLAETYGNMAMVNYPYRANFLEPLPAWPIKVACKFLSDNTLTGKNLIMGVVKAISVYYNYTGQARCLNTSTQAGAGLGDVGWSFQACSEMVMPMCSTGVGDMFEAATWNSSVVADSCRKQWGVTPRPDDVLIQYGGRDIAAASNIIFSNGKLDPWSGAGVLENISDTLVAIVIEEGAHHLDLRSSNPDDPVSVVMARNKEREIIKQWINEYRHVKMLQSNEQVNSAGAGWSVSDIIVLSCGTCVLMVSVLVFLVRCGRDRVSRRSQPEGRWLLDNGPGRSPSASFAQTIDDKQRGKGPVLPTCKT